MWDFRWLNGPNRQNRETLVRLTDLMTHRGPDGSGCLYSIRDGGFQIGRAQDFQSSTRRADNVVGDGLFSLSLMVKATTTLNSVRSSLRLAIAFAPIRIRRFLWSYRA
jgi:hypothetical protein